MGGQVLRASRSLPTTRLANSARYLTSRPELVPTQPGVAWIYLLAYEDDAATRALAQEAGFLPATLPALQARLDDPPRPGEPRRVVLGCALSAPRASLKKPR